MCAVICLNISFAAFLPKNARCYNNGTFSSWDRPPLRFLGSPLIRNIDNLDFERKLVSPDNTSLGYDFDLAGVAFRFELERDWLANALLTFKADVGVEPALDGTSIEGGGGATDILYPSDLLIRAARGAFMGELAGKSSPAHAQGEPHLPPTEVVKLGLADLIEAAFQVHGYELAAAIGLGLFTTMSRRRLYEPPRAGESGQKGFREDSRLSLNMVTGNEESRSVGSNIHNNDETELVNEHAQIYDHTDEHGKNGHKEVCVRKGTFNFAAAFIYGSAKVSSVVVSESMW